MSVRSPLWAGLNENAIGVATMRMFWVTAYSADSPARRWSIVSAPVVGWLSVNVLLLTPVNRSAPTPRSPRRPNFDAT